VLRRPVPLSRPILLRALSRSRRVLGSPTSHRLTPPFPYRCLLFCCCPAVTVVLCDSAAVVAVAVAAAVVVIAAAAVVAAAVLPLFLL
jgi:hypothetical protein